VCMAMPLHHAQAGRGRVTSLAASCSLPKPHYMIGMSPALVDGKLTTRIGRNSDDVRAVLRALVHFGAPEEILVTGKAWQMFATS